MREKVCTGRLTLIPSLHGLSLMLQLRLMIISISSNLISVKSSSAALIVERLMISMVQMILLVLEQM